MLAKNDENNVIEYKNVSDLNTALKLTIEKPYENIKVSGEISNFKISNKNLFATLKDNESTINVISWGHNYKKNQIEISNGDNIVIQGKIALYQKSGSYCLIANKFEKIGMGNLHNEYEQLKKKYELLGYFTNKKEFPQQINRVGIVTALEGAALQDILYVLKKNDFAGKVVIKGCLVQGTQAPQSIADEIGSLLQWNDNDGKRLDVIIIARGGGSFEDLVAFSSSLVIEAIHSSDIFTISAVGHEIDFMLSDFVADVRAPTPSVSAEIISTYQKNQLMEFSKCKYFVEDSMRNIIQMQLLTNKNKVSLLLKCINNPEDKLFNYEMELTKFEKHITNSMKSQLLQVKNKLEKLSGLLQKYDIRKMLEQGYVVVIKNNRIIDSINDIKSGQKLKLKMKDGDVNVIVT